MFDQPTVAAATTAALSDGIKLYASNMLFIFQIMKIYKRTYFYETRIKKME